MKQKLFIAFTAVWLLAVSAAIAFGQTPMPKSGKAKADRQAVVQELINKYPQAMGGLEATLDLRRRLLIPIIAITLNERFPGDSWGLLYRMDRQDDDPKPGRLTSDVLVWTYTNEHVDVLGGTSSAWIPHPVITDKDWLVMDPKTFPSWANQNGTPIGDPKPVPPTPPSVDLSKLETEIADLKDGLFQLRGEGAQVYKNVQNQLREILERLGAVEGQSQDNVNRLVTLESRTIPQTCHVRVFGLGVGCELR